MNQQVELAGLKLREHGFVHVTGLKSQRDDGGAGGFHTVELYASKRWAGRWAFFERMVVAVLENGEIWVGSMAVGSDFQFSHNVSYILLNLCPRGRCDDIMNSGWDPFISRRPDRVNFTFGTGIVHRSKDPYFEYNGPRFAE